MRSCRGEYDVSSRCSPLIKSEDTTPAVTLNNIIVYYVAFMHAHPGRPPGDMVSFFPFYYVASFFFLSRPPLGHAHMHGCLCLLPSPSLIGPTRFRFSNFFGSSFAVISISPGLPSLSGGRRSISARIETEINLDLLYYCVIYGGARHFTSSPGVKIT